MNLHNFSALRIVVYNFQETSPEVHLDLVDAWKRLIGEVEPVMVLLADPRDFFRGLCLWLAADREDTRYLVKLNGMISGECVTSKEMFESMLQYPTTVV